MSGGCHILKLIRGRLAIPSFSSFSNTFHDVRRWVLPIMHKSMFALDSPSLSLTPSLTPSLPHSPPQSLLLAPPSITSPYLTFDVAPNGHLSKGFIHQRCSVHLSVMLAFKIIISSYLISSRHKQCNNKTTKRKRKQTNKQKYKIISEEHTVAHSRVKFTSSLNSGLLVVNPCDIFSPKLNKSNPIQSGGEIRSEEVRRTREEGYCYYYD